MPQLRVVVTVAAGLTLLMALPAMGSASRSLETSSKEQALDGMLPRRETITGRLVNSIPEDQPGLAGWSLQRSQRLIPLDVSNVGERAQRLRGQRVELQGHYVNLGLGRTFVVTRIRRA